MLPAEGTTACSRNAYWLAVKRILNNPRAPVAQDTLPKPACPVSGGAAPPTKHIWFVGAHPDDLIGAAGTAIRFKETGQCVLHVVDVTRGERGLSHVGVGMDECARKRVAEEEQTCRTLGALPPVFLNEIDGESHAGKKTVQKLADLFKSAPPTAVFTHWPEDTHVVHVMTCALVRGALRDAGMASCELYFFGQSYHTLAFPLDLENERWSG